ncbi:MAG: L-Ala-D/L-Glu epimerase [Proteobacteria bacterium]|nr:L-Ala-D/L-Glu epimerase [Pseudomonadota bacterium]
MNRALRVEVESWPLREVFTISRGSKTQARVVLVEITGAGVTGRGECVPYARYGESMASVVAQIEGLRADIEAGLGRVELQSALPAGAARNALDCALWDLEARHSGRRVWQLAAVSPPQSVTTAYTLSMSTADAMAAAARKHAHRPLLKLKLGGSRVPEAVAAVRREAPQAVLILDANEAWTVDQLVEWMPHLSRAGVALIEQPLPAGQDDALADVDRIVPIGADESCHISRDVAAVSGRYDVVNIKLDKAGGLTEALAVRAAALAAGLDIMVGCMVSTSLAMAPAMLLAAGARFVDLDGPLLLASDREHGLTLVDGKLTPPGPELWG